MKALICMTVCSLLVLGGFWIGKGEGGQKEQTKTSGAEKKPAAKKIADLLEEPIELNNIHNFIGNNPMTLWDFLVSVDKLLSEKGKELPIFINVARFKEENPDAPDIFETQIRLKVPPRLKTVKLATLLRMALSQAPTNNATYLIRRDHVEITTNEAAHPERLLAKAVRARFEKTPLNEALEELAGMTGATIVLDGRVGDSAKTLVSAAFNNSITLYDAVRLLAEMADLRVEVENSIMFVTSKPKTDGGPQKSEIHFRERRLDLALKDLARWTGAAIVLDPKVKMPRSDFDSDVGGRPFRIELPEESNSPSVKRNLQVTASLKPTISAEAAVRILANQADLAVVNLGSAFFVTTPENAERIARETASTKK
ncbi:MAG: hypothetical protein HY040_16185 [Planctomycetes bacterium]|nr:hypothetical protein [Planctomycetota bacterium]